MLAYYTSRLRWAQTRSLIGVYFVPARLCFSLSTLQLGALCSLSSLNERLSRSGIRRTPIAITAPAFFSTRSTSSKEG